MALVYSSLVQSEVSTPRNELIKEYFHAGYTYNEIILILFHRHNISISVRQLNRVLRSLGLRRRGCFYKEEMLVALQNEIFGTGSCLGYRSMTQRLLSRHGFVVPRSVVSDFQRLLDPDGVSSRRSHRLRRRTYFNKGPNFLIHMDGYDKLKPYGFAIHGAICGYSRRVLWLRVSNTNNDPGVVASYFMSYVKDIKGVPRCIRSDAGTENVLVEDIQKAFRWQHTDDMAAEKSYLTGSSKSNQRIEQWWSWCKLRGCQFWIDKFAELVSCGMMSTADPLHISCARFCFMKLIQDDLDSLQAEWNQHSVRAHRQAETASGKPDIMFFLPQLYDTVDFKVAVAMDDVDKIATEWCKEPLLYGCSEDFVGLVSQRMRRMGFRMPLSFQEGIELYGKLLAILD